MLLKSRHFEGIRLALPLWRTIEFRFYLNFNFFFKIETTYSIARIIGSDCNLTARKRLTSTENLTTILKPHTSRSITEQIFSPNALKL